MKILYITSFTFLGILVQFLMHAIIEIVYIDLLLKNYHLFGLGLKFKTWFTIHDIFGILLLILGIMLGVQQGFYWWKKIYEKTS